MEKLSKTISLLQNNKFSIRYVKFAGNMYLNYTENMYFTYTFTYIERLVSAKVEKVLSLQKNDKKVTLLLIYDISGF